MVGIGNEEDGPAAAPATSAVGDSSASLNAVPSPKLSSWPRARAGQGDAAAARSDTFLAAYLHVQRREWSEHYVDFEALMVRVKKMEARLFDIRRQRRHASRHGHRHRHHSIGHEHDHCGTSHHSSSDGTGTGSPTSSAAGNVHVAVTQSTISPRHKYYRSEGFLPALAAAPQPAQKDDAAPAARLSSPSSTGSLSGGGDNFARLSPNKRNKSLDWLVHLPAAIAGAGTGKGEGTGGRMRSDSSAASIASSTDNNDRDWVQPGSEQFEFCSLIDSELEKAVLFYLAEVGRVADELSELSRTTSSLTHPDRSTTSTTDYSNLSNRYRSLGARLADLYFFVGSNLAAIRKVLTRHDRIVKPDGKALCRYYVRTRRVGETSHLQSLWGHDGLGAAYGSWRKGYQYALRLEGVRVGGVGEIDPDEEAFSKFRGDACVNCIAATASRIQDATHRSFKELVVLGSVGNTLALEPSVLADSVDDKDWDMAFYALQRDGLCGLVEMGSLSTYMENGAFGGEGGAAQFIGADLEQGKKAAEGFEYYLPLGLNLFSTFLYMSNYFIAGPTSAVYIETLGGHKALAGLVIGCTPWAAIASTILFSVWTNANFKHPLLFSGACLCIGNLLYGLALHFKSIELVLIGRIGVGLGGPRVINRRYIADVAPMESRTAVSAAFVTLSAAGTAVGPGLSALFQQIDFTIEFPSLGVFSINGLNVPGYFMFLVWFLFSIIVALTFKEPERHGLNELKDKALSPMTSRESSFCEEDKIASNNGVKKKDETLVSRRSAGKANNKDSGVDANAYVQYGNTEAEANETRPLISTVQQKGNKSEGRIMYAAIDESETPFQSGDDCTEEITAGTTESRSPWLSFCMKNFSIQVWICIILLFVDKLTMEAIMSSVPIVAGHSYDWSVADIGSLGVLMGILVVPLSICIGWVSRYYEDRVILVNLLAVSLIGILLLIDYPELFGEHPDHNSRYSIFCVGPHKYIYGCLIAFSGLQCLESVIMSMLSKVVPHSLAKGFCNSGLINTETGTFGRAIGDVAVTLAGLVTLDKMLNMLMIPLSCIVIVCLIIVKLFFHALAV